MPTQSIDTDIQSENVLISLLRTKSTAEKFSQIRSLSRTTIQLSKRAIQRVNRGLHADEIDVLFIQLHYGIEIAKNYQKQRDTHDIA